MDRHPEGHASVPQVTLMLALFGERDWPLSGNQEMIERVEQLHEAGMEVWVKKKKSFYKPPGVVMNDYLISKNQMPCSRGEAIQIISWLKTLPSVEAYD